MPCRSEVPAATHIPAMQVLGVPTAAARMAALCRSYASKGSLDTVFEAVPRLSLMVLLLSRFAARFPTLCCTNPWCLAAIECFIGLRACALMMHCAHSCPHVSIAGCREMDAWEARMLVSLLAATVGINVGYTETAAGAVDHVLTGGSSAQAATHTCVPCGRFVARSNNVPHPLSAKGLRVFRWLLARVAHACAVPPF